MNLPALLIAARPEARRSRPATADRLACIFRPLACRNEGCVRMHTCVIMHVCNEGCVRMHTCVIMHVCNEGCVRVHTCVITHVCVCMSMCRPLHGPCRATRHILADLLTDLLTYLLTYSLSSHPTHTRRLTHRRATGGDVLCPSRLTDLLTY